MNTPLRTRKKETGAALVVGLLLLVVLTLLAISTMNTASMELIMAGNEQFRSRAFNAGESGVEAGIRRLSIPTTSAVPPTTVAIGTGTDTYTYSITPQLNGRGITNVAKVTAGPLGFEAYYFRVTSSGSSGRGSTSTTTQEFFEIAPASGEFQRDTQICTGKDGLDASLTGC